MDEVISRFILKIFDRSRLTANKKEEQKLTFFTKQYLSNYKVERVN